MLPRSLLPSLLLFLPPATLSLPHLCNHQPRKLLQSTQVTCLENESQGNVCTGEEAGGEANSSTRGRGRGTAVVAGRQRAGSCRRRLGLLAAAAALLPGRRRLRRRRGLCLLLGFLRLEHVHCEGRGKQQQQQRQRVVGKRASTARYSSSSCRDRRKQRRRRQVVAAGLRTPAGDSSPPTHCAPPL